MTPPPRIRYYLMLPKHTAATVLEASAVLPWLDGFAACAGQPEVLADLEKIAAEDTRRVQALQLGEQAGWFQFLYQQRDPE